MTREQFIEDDKRAEINQHFAPLSVDMETTSIAQVCHANAIPFLSIHTITDTASHSGIENFEANCEAASEGAASITIEFLKRLVK